MLNPVTRAIYSKSDDSIYTYIDDDGQLVEPIFYAPIIPMILVNGSKGIGTGFSTDIPCYNPKEIIQKIKFMLGKGKINPELHPFYKGFLGTIIKVEENKYLCRGVYDKPKENIIHVSELPIGIWTDDYKQYLEGLIDKKTYVKDYTDVSTESNVDISIQFYPNVISKLESKNHEHSCNDLEKTLKLFNTINTNNMHMFDENEHLNKYNTIDDIIKNYYSVRLSLYEKRKDYQLKQLKLERNILKNKFQYIQELLNDTIDLRRKSQQNITDLLQKKGFDMVNDNYNYLIKMTMDSVSEENVERLKKEYNATKQQFDMLQKTPIVDIWFQELVHLEKVLETSVKLKVKIKKSV